MKTLDLTHSAQADPRSCCPANSPTTSPTRPRQPRRARTPTRGPTAHQASHPRRTTCINEGRLDYARRFGRLSTTEQREDFVAPEAEVEAFQRRKLVRIRRYGRSRSPPARYVTLPRRSAFICLPRKRAILSLVSDVRVTKTVESKPQSRSHELRRSRRHQWHRQRWACQPSLRFKRTPPPHDPRPRPIGSCSRRASR